jgi:hypothetical protein
MSSLTNLRTLAIGLKVMKTIPEPLLQLTGLESLSITFCRLQRLPKGLTAMHRLRELNLQGNPGLSVCSCRSLPCFPGFVRTDDLRLF